MENTSINVKYDQSNEEKNFDWINDNEKIEELKKVDTLIFQGGGVKGIAYVGALQCILYYVKDFLSKIKNVAGTSAGSIIAFLVACGFDMNKIEAIMNTTDFASFADCPLDLIPAIYQFLTKAYVCEGTKFVEWVQRILTQEFEQPMEPDVTFEKFKERTGRNLIVYAVRLNDSATIEFSAEKTPKVKVWLALRMSMSIPAFFKPVRVSMKGEGRDVEINHDENGDTFFVDGGVKANYPYSQVIESLQLQNNLERVLGFKILDSYDFYRYEHIGESSYFKKELSGYSYELVLKAVSSMMALQDDVFFSLNEAGESMRSRSICIYDLDMSAINFCLTKEEKEKLINSGLISVYVFVNGKIFKQGTIVPNYDKHDAKSKVENLRDQFNKFKKNNQDYANYSFGRLDGCCSDFKKYFDFLSTLKNRYSQDNEIVSQLDNLYNENTKFNEEMNKVLNIKKEVNVTLDITIVKGENLPNKHLGNVTDPHCYVSVDTQSKLTKKTNDSTNPVWNENFLFENVKISSVLSLVLYDGDSLLLGRVLGRVDVPLYELKEKETKLYLQNSATDAYIHVYVNKKN